MADGKKNWSNSVPPAGVPVVLRYPDPQKDTQWRRATTTDFDLSSDERLVEALKERHGFEPSVGSRVLTEGWGFRLTRAGCVVEASRGGFVGSDRVICRLGDLDWTLDTKDPTTVVLLEDLVRRAWNWEKGMDQYTINRRSVNPYWTLNGYTAGYQGPGTYRVCDAPTLPRLLLTAILIAWDHPDRVIRDE